MFPRMRVVAAQKAFIKAIMDDPADFTTRLVYADYLDDNNQSELAKRVRERVFYQQDVGNQEMCLVCRGTGGIRCYKPINMSELAWNLPAARRQVVQLLHTCHNCNGKGSLVKVFPLKWVLGDEDA